MKVLGYLMDKGTINENDAKMLSHLHIAFGTLDRAGNITIGEKSNGKNIGLYKKWNSNLKVILSIVSSDKDAFTVCAADEKLRKSVAESCVKVMQEYGFDGIDFDWEYPCVPSNGITARPEDKYNFTKLLNCVREEINKFKPDAVLSIAAGADMYYVESVELAKIAKCLDYICLMTYDLKCGFHSLTGHHSQLFSSTGDIFRNSCAQAMELFNKNGVPKEKLLMGVAFYSRIWENINDINHGFLQIAEKGAGYGPDFTGLKENCINKNGYVRYWDDEAKAPYLFNGSTFLTYDDEESISHKCAYVKEQAYGGVFYWEHSCDKTGTLLNCINENMK